MNYLSTPAFPMSNIRFTHTHLQRPTPSRPLRLYDRTMSDPTACANGLPAGRDSIYWKEGMASCTACGHNYLHSRKDPCHLCQMEVRLRALEQRAE